jgi:hypothetical protein
MVVSHRRIAFGLACDDLHRKWAVHVAQLFTRGDSVVADRVRIRHKPLPFKEIRAALTLRGFRHGPLAQDVQPRNVQWMCVVWTQ